MAGHEELRVAERFHCSNAQDDLFPGTFYGVELPVELVRHEPTRRGLHAIPVGAKSDQLIWIGEQRGEGGARVQAQALGLQWTEADTQQRGAARRDWHALPLRA